MRYPMEDQSKKSSGNDDQEPSNSSQNFIPLIPGKIENKMLHNNNESDNLNKQYNNNHKLQKFKE